MRRKATAAIVGHGFVLRLLSNLMDDVEDHKDKTGAMELETAYCHELQMDRRFSSMAIDTALYAFGNTVEHCIQRMGDKGLDMLLLHVGDNELAQSNTPAQVVADRVVQLATMAYARYPFRLVIMVGALPRSGQLEVTEEDYLDKVDEFNAALKEAASDDVHLRFVLLRGFSYRSDGQTPRDIDTWSDGVVPTDTGLWKYRNEVKFALTSSISIMLQHARDLRLRFWH